MAIRGVYYVQNSLHRALRCVSTCGSRSLKMMLNISVMGLDVLEDENHFQAAPRPKTVYRPPCSRAKVDEKDIKALLKIRYNNLRRLDGNHRELRLSNSTSPRRKSMPARPQSVDVKNSDVVKRGSVYQSSREVRSMRKLMDGRRNADPAYSDEVFLSFDIVDPLPPPSSSETIGFPQPKQSPLISLDNESTSPPCSHPSVPLKSKEFLELSFRDLPEEHVKLSSSGSGSAPVIDSLNDNTMEFHLHSKEMTGNGSVEEQKFDRDQMFCKETDGKILSERDPMCNLPKSFSTKAVLFNSSCQSEGETSKASPKSRFSPFKKMLDPIMKSKSLRNPSFVETEIGGSTAVNPPSIKRHRGFRKSLLNDFSKTTEKMNYDDESADRDKVPTTVSSPAHLHAVLKLDCKHGAPSYEFAIKDPEDVLLAKTWRTDSAFNWVYTFHSSKKKVANSSGWGSKERHGQSPPMVGQMQVSCYLCSEVSDNGSLESSTVMEFVLYDITQARRSFARRSFAIDETSHCPSDSTQPPSFTIGDSLAAESPPTASHTKETERHQYRRRNLSSDFDSDPSSSYPWTLADLHSYSEIAAIVIQIPFSKKEVKELQVQENRSAKQHKNMPSPSATDQGSDTTFECMDHANVKVVTPSGTHGLPSNEEGSPSSLLDRWRFGGGCDCGGWDMGCPIVVLDNPCAVNDAADHPAKGSQQQVVLFVQIMEDGVLTRNALSMLIFELQYKEFPAQGRKEKIPALSIISDGKGQYSVDFHAQFSALQAFSICISVLHSSEAASALSQEKGQRLYSNSLKLILEEEVRHLLEAVAEEEKRKAKKKTEQPPPSFILDPPFSPMGRV